MKKHIFSVGFILAFLIPSMGQKQRTLMDKFKFIPVENQHYSPDIFYNENDTTLLSSSLRLVQNESTLDHYFIAKQEVSNAEYLLFERWVMDSLFRVFLFRSNLQDPNPWGTYVNYTTRLKDNVGYYKLNWNEPFPGDKKALNFLKALKNVNKESYWKRNRELQSENLYYTFQTSFQQVDVYRGDLHPDREYFYDENVEQRDFLFKNPNSAVVGISFDQAEAFCDWYNWVFQTYYEQLSRKERAQLPKSSIFRLPNAYEWEQAALLNKRNYHPSYQNNYGQYCVNYGPILSDRGMLLKNSYDDGYYQIAPVSSYEPGSIGLFNMLGNAAEWTTTTPEIPYLSIGKLLQSEEPSFSEEDKNAYYRFQTAGSDSLFIEDPSTHNIERVQRFSKEHQLLMIKRNEHYRIYPNDTKEDILAKFYELNSLPKKVIIAIDDSMKISSENQSLISGNIVDGVVVQEWEILPYEPIVAQIYDNYWGTNRLLNAYEMNQIMEKIDRYLHDVKVLKLNQQNPEYNLSSLRIVKGGSWNSSLNAIDIFAQEVYASNLKNEQIGFRLLIQTPSLKLK